MFTSSNPSQPPPFGRGEGVISVRCVCQDVPRHQSFSGRKNAATKKGAEFIGQSSDGFFQDAGNVHSLSANGVGGGGRLVTP